MQLELWLICGLLATLVFALTLVSQQLWRQLVTQYQEQLESWLQHSLTTMFLFIPVRLLLQLLVLAQLLFSLLLWLLGVPWLVIILLIPTSGLCATWLYRRLKKRRRQQFLQQLPDTLGIVANSLRAGGTMQGALQFARQELTAPMRDELTLVLRQLRLGVELKHAVTSLSERFTDSDVQGVVLVLQLGQESGGQQAPLLERMATTIRKKQQARQKLQSLSAQGRMQGQVMSALPLFIGGVLWFIEGSAMRSLLGHWLGWALIGLLALLIICGQVMIHRMLHRSMPL